MSHLDPKHPATPRDLRNFGLLVGGAFGLLAVFFAWRHQAMIAAAVVGTLAAILMAGGVFTPSRLAQPYRWWMSFALVMSKITTPILMGVIYFPVLTPVALLRRTFGRNPLNVENHGSRWVTRPAHARRSVLERQF